jgi:hypothetical protein
MKKFSIPVLIVLLVALGLWLKYNEVEVDVTPEDQAYAQVIMQHTGLPSIMEPANRTYAQELQTIKAIQQGVLRTAPANGGIPHGQNREPKDLCRIKIGLCYDRSRVIEKVLKVYGFETRHISVFLTETVGKSPLGAITSAGTPSHAISEVKTRHGWMVVDSNLPWIAVDASGEARSIEEIQESIKTQPISWPTGADKNMLIFYKVPFTYLLGLYSRHGGFYPPYNFFPDINWSEFAQNL